MAPLANPKPDVPCRVYGDRMIKDEHKNQLIGLIDDQLKENQGGPYGSKFFFSSGTAS